jgi:hypothetical protein
LRAIGLLLWVDDLGMAQPAHQEAHASVDFSEAAFAIEVIAVLRPVAVAGGPGDDVDDTGTLGGAEVVEFGGESGVALGRHVEAAAGQAGRAVVFVVDDGRCGHGGMIGCGAGNARVLRNMRWISSGRARMSKAERPTRGAATGGADLGMYSVLWQVFCYQREAA